MLVWFIKALCRRHKRFDGLEVSRACCLKVFEDDNAVLAEAMLDAEAFKATLSQKYSLSRTSVRPYKPDVKLFPY